MPGMQFTQAASRARNDASARARAVFRSGAVTRTTWKFCARFMASRGRVSSAPGKEINRRAVDKGSCTTNGHWPPRWFDQMCQWLWINRRLRHIPVEAPAVGAIFAEQLDKP